MAIFGNRAASESAQGRRHIQIIPNDAVDLVSPPRAIYCAAAGTIVIRDEFGVDLPYALTAGQVLPFRGVRVLATGTTGTYYAWY